MLWTFDRSVLPSIEHTLTPVQTVPPTGYITPAARAGTARAGTSPGEPYVIVDLHPGRMRPWDLIGVLGIDPAGLPFGREISPSEEHLGLAAECLRQWARASGTVGPVRIFMPPR
jgi:hypothetical protein